MAWEILALTTAVLYGIQSLVFRQIMKGSNNIAYTWLFNLLSSIFFFIIFIRNLTVPFSIFPWLLVVLASFLWITTNLIGFEAYKHTEVSLKAPLSRVGLLFIFVLSVVILNETLALHKILGILLIFFGVVIITWEKGFLGKISHKGVRLTILTEVIFSIVAIVDKITVQYFSPAMYGFLVFFIPSLILMPPAIKNFANVKKLLAKKFLVISSILLGVVGYFLQLTAYTLTDISNVAPIVELSVLVSVFGGYFVHKEKEFRKRLIGAIIMILGSIFILRPGLL